MTWSVFLSKTDFCSHSSILRCLFWSSNPFTHTENRHAMVHGKWLLSHAGPLLHSHRIHGLHALHALLIHPTAAIPLVVRHARHAFTTRHRHSRHSHARALTTRAECARHAFAAWREILPTWCLMSHRIGLWQGIHSRKLTVELEYTSQKIYKNDEFLGFILFSGCNLEQKQFTGNTTILKDQSMFHLRW